MKKTLLLMILALALTACSGQIQTPADDGADKVSLGTEVAKAVEETVAVASTAEAEAKSIQETSDAANPTATEEPTATSTTTPTPTVTEADETAMPTATATAVAFDPKAEYGGPDLLDTFSTNGNWVDGSGKLPNSDYLRMSLGANQLLVTGKPAGFDTWWFTYLGAGDQFLEMKVEVDDCAGRQAYGLIARGSAKASDNHGYIITLSCDGAYQLRRLDGSNPYSVAVLIPWTESDLINAGDDELNILGIRFVDDTITIYANGEQLDEITDDTYSTGQFGLFVNAGPAANFTYIVDEISFWDLD